MALSDKDGNRIEAVPGEAVSRRKKITDEARRSSGGLI